jgi:kynureninase
MRFSDQEPGAYRDRFVRPDPSLVYLDGNSLGRMPAASAALASKLQERWADRLIRGWNDGWAGLPLTIGEKVSQVIGTPSGSTVIADSTSVNLFKLGQAALVRQAGRSRIITDDLNFPSDRYLLAQLAAGKHTLEFIPSQDGEGPVEAIIDALDESVALVSLSATAYHSGYTYDVKRITDACHAVGAMVLWDLSHTAGSVPVDLTGADLAVGCCYKHLNGGPGAPAFLYVRPDLIEELDNPVQGWMGHADTFSFSPEFAADRTIKKFLTGTPPVFSMALIEPGLDLHLEVGSEWVRWASLQLTDRFIEGFDETLASLGFDLQSPRERDRRGSHVTLGHRNGLAIDQALIHDHNIVPDFRPPTGIRFGFAALYNTGSDVDAAIEALQHIVTSRSWEKYVGTAQEVT